MNVAGELKTCELCGRLFVRPVPQQATVGVKICPSCLSTPPDIEEEEVNVVCIRSYRVTGIKFRG